MEKPLPSEASTDGRAYPPGVVFPAQYGGLMIYIPPLAQNVIDPFLHPLQLHFPEGLNPSQFRAERIGGVEILEKEPPRSHELKGRFVDLLFREEAGDHRHPEGMINPPSGQYVNALPNRRNIH